jgi:hypothetical protein
MTWDVSMPGLMILSEGALDRFLLSSPKNVRFTPQPQGRLIRSLSARPHSAKTHEFSARGSCAKKRMSFRCLPRPHKSVVFRVSAKTVEFMNLTVAAVRER